VGDGHTEPWLIGPNSTILLRSKRIHLLRQLRVSLVVVPVVESSDICNVDYDLYYQETDLKHSRVSILLALGTKIL
jgi:hypothetical protein